MKIISSDSLVYSIISNVQVTAQGWSLRNTFGDETEIFYWRSWHEWEHAVEKDIIVMK